MRKGEGVTIGCIAHALGVKDTFLILELVRATERVFEKKYTKKHGRTVTFDGESYVQDMAKVLLLIRQQSEDNDDE